MHPPPYNCEDQHQTLNIETLNPKPEPNPRNASLEGPARNEALLEAGQLQASSDFHGLGV